MRGCINCKSKKIKNVVKIEPQPLSGVFLEKKKNKSKKISTKSVPLRKMSLSPI